MNRYVISFSKQGYSIFTSHLDMLRLFKRAFRRAGIPLSYSQGFNPHPKMSFAQPLSLGYSAKAELLEFETDAPCTKDQIISSLTNNLAEGVQAVGFGLPPEGKKSLAALVDSGTYTISFPEPYYGEDYPALAEDYLAQDKILALKKSKKSKTPVQTDIRGKIRSLEVFPDERDMLAVRLAADQGSQSNLSPELVISTFSDFCGLDDMRWKVDVCREKLGFPVDIAIEWL